MGTYAEPSGIRMDFTTDEREWFDKWESVPIGWVSYITPGNTIQLHRVHPAFKIPQTDISDALELQRIYAKEKSLFDEEQHSLEKSSILYRAPDNSDRMQQNSKLLASVTHPFFTHPDKTEDAIKLFGIPEYQLKDLSSGAWIRVQDDTLEGAKESVENTNPGSLGKDLYRPTYNAHKAFLGFLRCAEKNGRTSSKIKLVRSVSTQSEEEESEKRILEDVPASVSSETDAALKKHLDLLEHD